MRQKDDQSRLRWSSAVIFSLLAGSGSASAQVIAPAERAVTGVIVDSVSGHPLSGVVLYFTGRGDEYFSSGDGRFRIPGIGLRDTTLVVRRIGFVPRRVAVPASPSAMAMDIGSVLLRPVATQLDRIAVETEEVARYPQLSEFYRRKQSGVAGVFVTREDIQRTGARKTSEILRRTTKVELDCSNDRIGDDQCVARNRRGRNISRVLPPSTRRRPAAGAEIPEDTASLDFSFDRCQMDVWVDGTRSSLTVDEIPLSWIAGIEVYSGLATTPPGLGHGRCGVVAIWTTRAGG
ncbi:MAG: hypothetical protein HY560_13815 [Gemmatimonadetes bacterium]|nr:hypothetical protein [Gemmatimonadota bacterium]